MSDKTKQRARTVQGITGESYSTCLALVRRDVRFVPAGPAASDCLIALAMREVKVPYAPVPGIDRPCDCTRCIAYRTREATA